MAAILLMLLPIAILALGWYVMYRKFPAFRFIHKMLSSLLRWLWQEKQQRSGGGKIKPPRTRYYNN